MASRERDCILRAPAAAKRWIRSPFPQSLANTIATKSAYQKALARIDEWSWPFAEEAPQAVPVHLFAGAHDWQHAAWLLASWFHFTEATWPIVVHDDGTLPGEATTALHKLFPSARIISREEADAAVRPTLAPFPFCETFRESHLSAMKIFDVQHFSSAERLFLFESSLLFFQHPRELIDWTQAGDGGCWFGTATEDREPPKVEELRDELGIEAWPDVHAGLCLLQKRALDLEFIDTALARTSILRGRADRAMQTLLMLCAARAGGGGLLPASYEISSARRSHPEAISRLYLGEADEPFVKDGLKRVEPHLFPRDR